MKDAMDGAEDPRKDPRFGLVGSWIPFAYHLIPRHALARVAAIFRVGELAGRGDRAWEKIPKVEQLNHAMSHIIAHLDGRTGKSHLAHAACRILMALELDEDEPVLLPDPPLESGHPSGSSGKVVPGSLRVSGRVEPGGPVGGTGDGTSLKKPKFVEGEGWKTSGERLWERHKAEKRKGIPGWGRGNRPGPETLEKVLHYSKEEKDNRRNGSDGLHDVGGSGSGEGLSDDPSRKPNGRKDQDVGPGEEGGG